ncbi:glycosyltransferase WbuB [Pandoraea sputorum]|uniref:Glycosyltransferase WbuB n=1 Tax=Pandoraea sputorum TaxID=93222 RepID=A0A5E5B8W8_9BURK|nr:glycosyltransferase WbuB [Pandoraea sputorum]
MRVLILCTKFSTVESDGWLTNDLAAAYASAKHDVTVVCVDWSGQSHSQVLTMYGNVRVINTPIDLSAVRRLPASLQKMYKWFWASRAAIPYIDQHLAAEPYDLFVGFSPASTAFWVQRHLLKRLKPKRKYMVLWDFFPRYHHELGLIPAGPIFKIAKCMETLAIKQFDTVGVMSPANIPYFWKETPTFAGQVEVLPLWGPQELAREGDRKEIRGRYGLPQDGVVAIFGGQLIPGRGIELLLRLAEASSESCPGVIFAIAGSGPLEGYLKARLTEPALSNVRYLGKIPRDEYLTFLTACDIGVVFNSGTVSVPTFPSKSIDYFRAGLPILGAVEAATDYSEILENDIHGGYSSVTTQFERIQENLAKLCASESHRRELGENGRKYFQAKMTAPQIVAQIH